MHLRPRDVVAVGDLRLRVGWIEGRYAHLDLSGEGDSYVDAQPLEARLNTWTSLATSQGRAQFTVRKHGRSWRFLFRAPRHITIRRIRGAEDLSV